jgi:hypothetical protein
MFVWRWLSIAYISAPDIGRQRAGSPPETSKDRSMSWFLIAGADWPLDAQPRAPVTNTKISHRTARDEQPAFDSMFELATRHLGDHCGLGQTKVHSADRDFEPGKAPTG